MTARNRQVLTEIHCVACSRKRSYAESALGAISVLLFPLVMLRLSVQGTNTTLSILTLVAALLMYPVVVLAHELGHAAAGYVLGLEIGAIGVGYGRILWRGEFRGIPFNWHLWPITGRVYLGSASTTTAGFRARLWLAILAGPLTNLVLLGVTLATWHVLEPVVGAPLLKAWVFSNALVGVTALIPMRSTDLGQPVRSDGLSLLRIPRLAAKELEIYSQAILARSLYRFNAKQYEAARVAADEVMTRDPSKPAPRLLASACHIMLGNYAEALAVLTPILGRVQSEVPQLRAAVYNNVALALLMSNVGAAADDANLREAERLSALSFGMYPCELSGRSTRALVLTANEQPDQALALLAYQHYDAAKPQERGHRELARAFALTRLGKVAESRAAAELAMQLDPGQGALTRTLGILTMDIQHRRTR